MESRSVWTLSWDVCAATPWGWLRDVKQQSFPEKSDAMDYWDTVIEGARGTPVGVSSPCLTHREFDTKMSEVDVLCAALDGGGRAVRCYDQMSLRHLDRERVALPS